MEVPDTFKSRVYKTLPIPPERFETYFAPMLLAGATFPKGETSGFAWSAAANFGFRIPHIAYYQLGEFIGVSMESRAFQTHDGSASNIWSSQFIAVTPGLSFRGIISAGVTIGLPISSALASYGGGGYYLSGFGWESPIKASLLNVLVEPRLIIGIPLRFFYSGQTLMLVAQAGYPLSPTFKQDALINGPLNSIDVAKFNSILVPEISIGLSYVLPLFSQNIQGLL